MPFPVQPSAWKEAFCGPAFVDRLFYSVEYDAARALGAFSEKLRDDADLDGLDEDLVKMLSTTATATAQPAHASLWLRPAARERSLDHDGRLSP